MTTEEEAYDISDRAAELAQMKPQELLGYIAALLELVARNQVGSTEAILADLSGTITVTGDVEVTNLPTDW